MEHLFYFSFFLFFFFFTILVSLGRNPDFPSSLFFSFAAMVEAQGLLFPCHFGMCDYGKYLLSIPAFPAHPGCQGVPQG